MKVRIFPKKEAVLALVDKRIEDLESYAELAAKNGDGAHVISMYQDAIVDMNRSRDLILSHDAPELHVELVL